VGNLDAEDRGVRRARFAVLRDARMPAILIEGGYMTNPYEGKQIYTAAYRHQMVQAIVKGILAYQKLTLPPPTALPVVNHHPGKSGGGPSVKKSSGVEK
jgi:N-acetylmuramoyl-L-alanine amidase